MSIAINAWKCEKCNHIYEEKEKADNCCRCKDCKYYIGKYDRKSNFVHCSLGYTCDSYKSRGKNGAYSKFKPVS